MFANVRRAKLHFNLQRMGLAMTAANKPSFEGNAATYEPTGRREASQAPPGWGKLLWRALRLQCPRCGAARVFRGWFAMHDRCPACGRKFNRSPGYFLGSIYFNYGLTAGLVVAAYFSLYFSELVTGGRLLALLTVFIVVFPLWFFRYARSLWLAVDEGLDPWPNAEERGRGEG
jgi:uncharacterized protein (DUF983 family)